MPLNPGHSLLNGHYHIVRLLGQGGFGFVYQARDTLLYQTVAIKELIPALVGDEATLKRFLVEARATMRLTHRHVVRTHNVFHEGDNYYIVMEHMAGGSLEQRLREGSALTVNEAVRVGAQVCEGLACAHEEQVVHCDLKPANILFDAVGRAKVADFGVAHVSGEMLTRSWHTPAGFVAGTLPYMSPEQLDGVRDDARIDVYALGAVLYRMLTGHTYLAFEPQDTPRAQAENVSRIYSESPSPPSQHNPRIPTWLDSVVLCALAKEPEERYPSAVAMRAALLQQYPEPAPASSPDLAPTMQLAPDQRAAGAPPAPERQTPLGPRARAAPAEKKRAAVAARFWLAVGVAVVVLVALAIAIGAILGGGDGTASTVRATVTLAPTLVPAPQAGDRQTRSADGMVMVYVPAGEFTMGSERFDNEKPVHTVYLDSFWIDRTEVTNAQFRNCVEAGACQAPTTCDDGFPNYDHEGKANHPVVCIDWNQAKSYCQWAEARLPTEAEWEKAARGTAGQLYPWGDDPPSCDRVNTYIQSEGDHCVGHSAEVGSYPAGASPYGALDMAGNVWEWVADWYDADYYASSPPGNPQGPESGLHKVLRGGCWLYGSPDIRTAFRVQDPPDIRRYQIGFRCAASAGD